MPLPWIILTPARRRRWWPALLLAAMLLTTVSCSPDDGDPPGPPPATMFRTVGNSDDARWLIQRSGGGDFVILTTALYSQQEDEQYYADMKKLGAVDSITTLTVNSRAKADANEVENAIRNAELLFIDGGDQGEYYELWKGTRLQAAVQQLLQDKKVPLGGTSAGMAVLSGLAYIPLNQGVASAQALGDPFHANMNSLKNDFFVVPFLNGTITDTHWSERNRCGRTIAFLARAITDSLAPFPSARAIACDESTAVCIDGQAQAVVFGREKADDFAYFISCRSVPDRCLPGLPLHWPEAVRVWKVRGNEAGTNRFDLATWQAWGGTLHDVNVEDGVLSVDIQTPR
jgi:cyanophycinase-like exopeptidase